ncbi:hypothetical protein ACIBG8_52645 [Nonomuraea sp. NPDC050556]|uniref:hypothetical protein n=1 Tax=Nonomuraea sp. NPDC050556 TaxID=3364369 RepID=UPI00378C87B6
MSAFTRGAALVAVALIAGCSTARASLTSLDDGRPRVDANYLVPGDCLVAIDDLMAARGSCAEPHVAEFVTSYILPEGPWPGEERARALSEDWCVPRVKARLVEPDAAVPGVLLPLEREWRQNPRYRTAYCVAVTGPGQATLTSKVIK